MNINPTAAYSAYKTIERSGASTHPVASAEVAASRVENTDQIRISAEGARQLEVERVSSAILSELQQPTAPERLESLKAAVQSGSYHVPTDKLVGAMMNRWFGM